MKSSRVLVLVHPDLIPPQKATKKEVEWAEWRGEYHVTSTLMELGHRVEAFGASADLNDLREKLLSFKPHIVFNMLEEFAGKSFYDQNIVSYLQLLGVCFTGNSPRGLMLARDKALSKKILAHHGIPVPEFQIFPRFQKVRPRPTLPYPMIVKSQYEESSLGISQASVVYSEKKLLERVRRIHESVETAAIAERYIEGRELYVGVVGNQQLQILTPWELLIKRPKDKAHFIATSHVKHSPAFQKRVGVNIVRAKLLPSELEERMKRICRSVYESLYLSGYARIDFRLSESGIPYVLEANPNPDISADEELGCAAAHDGVSYPKLLEQILRAGLNGPEDLF